MEPSVHFAPDCRIYPAVEFPHTRTRWNTNEDLEHLMPAQEIIAILLAFDRHGQWFRATPPHLPPSGSMMLFNRTVVRYRKDGFWWKTRRKQGNMIREDHMKLKVKGVESIYGCYVHSAILPTFHRRCYWLLEYFWTPTQYPDVVLVHYLNLPCPDDYKLVLPTLAQCVNERRWPLDELLRQLRPMLENVDARFLASAEADLLSFDKLSAVLCNMHSGIIDRDLEAREAKQLPQRSGASRDEEVPSFGDGEGKLLGLLEMPSDASDDEKQYLLVLSAPNTPLPPSSVATDGRTTITPVKVFSLPSAQARSMLAANPSLLLTPAAGAAAPAVMMGESLQPVSSQSTQLHPGHCLQSQDSVTSTQHHLLNHKSTSDLISDNQLLPDNVQTLITTPALSNSQQLDANIVASQLRFGSGCSAVKNELSHFSESDVISDQGFIDEVSTMSDAYTNDFSQSSTRASTINDANTSANDCYIRAFDVVDVRPEAINSTPSKDSSEKCRFSFDGDEFVAGFPEPTDSSSGGQQVSSSSGADTSFDARAEEPPPIFRVLAEVPQVHDESTQYCAPPPPLISSPADHSSMRFSPDLPFYESHRVQCLPAGPHSAFEQYDIAPDFSDILQDNLNSLSVADMERSIRDGFALDNIEPMDLNSPHYSPRRENAQASQQPSVQSCDASRDALTDFEAIGFHFVNNVSDDGIAARRTASHESSPIADGYFDATDKPDGDAYDRSSGSSSPAVSDERAFHRRRRRDSASLMDIVTVNPQQVDANKGTKLLVIGPWCSSAVAYSASFGDEDVPATLLQNGVLSCHTPALDCGDVDVVIKQADRIISNPFSLRVVALTVSLNDVVLTDRIAVTSPDDSATLEAMHKPDPLAFLTDDEKRHRLLAKFDYVETYLDRSRRLPVSSEPLRGSTEGGGGGGGTPARHTSAVERAALHLVSQCAEHPINRSAFDPARYDHGPTLLHLAAGLGYDRLIRALIHWRERLTQHRQSSPTPLDYEVDGLKLDTAARTALHYACEAGHTQAALLLAHWNWAATRVSDAGGLTPSDHAKARGHDKLVAQLDLISAAQPRPPGFSSKVSRVTKTSANHARKSSNPIVSAAVAKHSSTPAKSHSTPASIAKQSPSSSFSPLTLTSLGAAPVTLACHRATRDRLSHTPSTESGSSASYSRDRIAPSSCSSPGGGAAMHTRAPYDKTRGSVKTPTTSRTKAVCPQRLSLDSIDLLSAEKATPSGKAPAHCPTVSHDAAPAPGQAAPPVGGTLKRKSAAAPSESGSDAAQSLLTPLVLGLRSQAFPPHPSTGASGTRLFSHSFDLGMAAANGHHCPQRLTPAPAPPTHCPHDYAGGPGSSCSGGGASHWTTSGSIPFSDSFSSSVDSYLSEEIFANGDFYGDMERHAGDRPPFQLDASVGPLITGGNGLIANLFEPPPPPSGFIDPQTGEAQFVSLADHIIAAMPERIKLSPSTGNDEAAAAGPSWQPGTSAAGGSFRERSGSPPRSSAVSSRCSSQSAIGEDSGISTPLVDGLAFDDYRLQPPPGDCCDIFSAISPDSNTCLLSPLSFTLDSPPPSTEELEEYFNIEAGELTAAAYWYMSADLSKLTLNDEEQRRLYEAAKVIQAAYRHFRARKLEHEQRNREIRSAVLIQSYYRRFKEFAYYKRMTQAAVLIQSQFRSYAAQKRYRRTREAARLIQTQYRTYKQHEEFKRSRSAAAMLIQQRYRSHYERKRLQDKHKLDTTSVCVAAVGASATACGLPPAYSYTDALVHPSTNSQSLQTTQSTLGHASLCTQPGSDSSPAAMQPQSPPMFSAYPPPVSTAIFKSASSGSTTPTNFASDAAAVDSPADYHVPKLRAAFYGASARRGSYSAVDSSVGQTIDEEESSGGSGPDESVGSAQ